MTWTQHDSIMVVVDKLTKAAHFIPVKSTHKTDDIAKIFMKDISWKKMDFSLIKVEFISQM